MDSSTFACSVIEHFTYAPSFYHSLYYSQQQNETNLVVTPKFNYHQNPDSLAFVRSRI
jgi:hypothetical protein